jgi:stage V sporulation protein SpoVS
MEFGVFGVERALASAHEYLTESGIDAKFIPKHFTKVRVLCSHPAFHTALSEPWVNAGGP